MARLDEFKDVSISKRKDDGELLRSYVLLIMSCAHIQPCTVLFQFWSGSDKDHNNGRGISIYGGRVSLPALGHLRVSFMELYVHNSTHWRVRRYLDSASCDKQGVCEHSFRRELSRFNYSNLCTHGARSDTLAQTNPKEKLDFGGMEPNK